MSTYVASEGNLDLPADVDPRLWFEMSGCEGRTDETRYFVRGYLSGNQPKRM